MPTAKIYGLERILNPVKSQLSDAIHSCVSEALDFPKENRLQRFFGLSEQDFYYGKGRSEKYIIIEIALFEGRSKETIKKLIMLLYERVPSVVGMDKSDLDIMVFELPRHCWGLQGEPGDEKQLSYEVSI